MVLSWVKNRIHWLLALGAYWWYGRPARKLIVVGVTGTKGKSSVCRCIASVLEAGGYKVALLTTVEFQIADKHWLNDKKMTMLGRGQIQKMLRDAVDAGCTYAVVETSSEGILQYRHVGLEYDIAVFTNLGTEHQERHGGFENLRRDKGKLFAAITKHPQKNLNGKSVRRVSVVNADDANADFYLRYPADETFVYSMQPNPNKAGTKTIQGAVQGLTASGSRFTVSGFEYSLNLVGEFNIYNALAAVAVGQSQGILPTQIQTGLASIKQIPGRMEFIREGQPFAVVVDYAHEEISLKALFTILRTIVGAQNKIIGVIGSDGGGRDVSKRPRMGAVSGHLADYVVITDVNCFDEDPQAIAGMLAEGARKAGKRDNVDLFVEVDRREAIKKALSLAKPGDAVAITAKGTEPCIVVAGGKKIPWDDRTVTREILHEMF